MEPLIRAFVERGDLAHLALLLWALGASAGCWRTLNALAQASSRLDDFIRELARFNAHFDEEL